MSLSKYRNIFLKYDIWTKKTMKSKIARLNLGITSWRLGSATLLFMLSMSLMLGKSTSEPVFDLYQKLKPADIIDEDVIVVLIDDASIASIGQWPFPRYVMARLIEKINFGEPSVVGFSIIFSEEEKLSPSNFISYYPELNKNTQDQLKKLPSMDVLFSSVIANTISILGFAGIDAINRNIADDNFHSSVFDKPLPNNIGKYSSFLDNIKSIDEVGYSKAILNVPFDDDGVVRSIWIGANVGNYDRTSLPLDMLRVHRRSEKISLIFNSKNSISSILVGNHKFYSDNGGTIRPYLSKLHLKNIVSAGDVIFGITSPSTFKNKAVLIGVSAAGASANISTPMESRQNGAIFIGQTLQSLINNKSLNRPQWGWQGEYILAVLLAIAAMIGIERLNRVWSLVLPVGVAIALGLISWMAFLHYQILLDPLRPLVISGMTALVLAGQRFAETAKARTQIRQAFYHYLSPEMVDRIARDPSQLLLGGQERDMTVLFCDVRGFSAISERLEPQQIIQFLVGLLSPMTDILLEHRSTIDKYIGDAIVAFWNAPLDDPDHVRNAADAALAMRNRLNELNREMPFQSRYPWPGDVKIGIGLNAGPVCVGNMGSERRLAYSIVGDTVNLASRIEGLTKYYGIDIAIGNDLASRLCKYAIVEIDIVRVIGRDQQEAIHYLVGGPDLALEPDFLEFRDKFKLMRTAYLECNWNRAISEIRQLMSYRYSKEFSRLFEIYLERIDMYRITPPPTNWNGIYIANTK